MPNKARKDGQRVRNFSIKIDFPLTYQHDAKLTREFMELWVERVISGICPIVAVSKDEVTWEIGVDD